MRMVIFSLFIISYFYSQILLVLLRIEFLILRTFMILSQILIIRRLIVLMLYFLFFVVCEGVLGLTLLVFYIRTIGNDNLRNLDLILW